MTTKQSTRRFIPDSEVCIRYGVHPSTLYNWDKNPKLNFPKPYRINNRKYRNEPELDRFDQERAAERDAERAAECEEPP
jgi:predicted DNA-binding transcriptional regulator AlpA